MINTLSKKRSRQLESLGKTLKAKYWFPHGIMAVLFVLGGVWLFQTDLGDHWIPYLKQLFTGQVELSAKNVPPLVVGGGMILMSFGLLLHSRVAWSMSLFLASLALISIIWSDRSMWQLLYFVFLISILW